MGMMKRIFTEAAEATLLDTPDFDLVEVPVTEPDPDAEYAAHANPLGLTVSDLVAVGWDSNGKTWVHGKVEGEHDFFIATRVEAHEAGLGCDPLDPISEDF
jgi:hypothetical protein